ncbi:MAG: hypothetical protein A3F72_00260 [Bacteroidetes bacterium RIFCSPLOWO2_12_FULL_35_15]|nr:MAG: hypothetical protein A3F72_00260 [Bacteroidetes bacterium RIFCSPLOWO2_12_FULL_35_15]
MKMKKLILGIIIGGIVGAVLILLIIVLFNRHRSDDRGGLRLVKIDSTSTAEIKNQQILVYGDYLDLDSTDYLLIPLGMKTIDGGEGKSLRSKSQDEYSESYTGSSRSYKYNFYSLDFGNCNNIIFYNKKNDETHLMLQNPAIISQFYFPYYNKEYVGEKYYFILVGIRGDDTNADGYINSEDAEKVYISDLSGKNLYQITPDNTQLVDWFIDVKTNNILMKVRFDTNKDQKFNYYDEIEILKTSIKSPVQGKEIISKEIKINIKKILDKIK